MEKKKIGVYAGKFNILHQGHITAVLKSYSSCDELFVFVTYDELFEQQRYEENGMKNIPPYKRARWFTEIFKYLDNFHVSYVENKNTNDFIDWKKGAEGITEYIKENSIYSENGEFDIMFSTEPTYSKHFDILYPYAEHVTFPKMYELSATRILEEGIFNHLDSIPRVVKRDFIKKIAVLGGESSGKSTLVQKLAVYFNTRSIKEFGRTLWDKYGGKTGKVFDLEDYRYLTYKQKTMEYEELDNCNKYLFVDTETIVTKTWLNFYDNKEDTLLNEISREQNYDLYILLYPNNEFKQDGTRNFGENNQRIEIFNKMRESLETLNKNYIVLKGNNLEVFNQAVEVIESL